MKTLKQNSKPLVLAVPLLMAPMAVNSAGMLEEIIVSAQKRQESLQDVNLAVSAVTGDRMEEFQIDTVEDLQGMVPSLSAGNDFAFAKIFIRGIGLNSSFAGVDPSVALHVDGAVNSLSYSQLGSFFDLDRVEVLRGPQGTLYGRNATGGAINLITRKPSEEYEGYVRVTAGTDSLLRTEAAVGGPLTDRILGRISVKHTDRDGYGINELSGNDVDDANKKSARVHLQFNFSDDVDLLLSSEWHDEDDAGLGLKYIESLSNLDPTFLPPPGAGGFAVGQRNVASELDNKNQRDSVSTTATLNWRFNDQWRLTSITNYRDSNVRLLQDIDFSTNINNQIQDNRTTSEQISEELQLHYEGDRMRGLLAFWYYDEHFTNANQIGFARAADGLVRNVFFTADVDIESIALFGNFEYDLTDNLTLNLGGRWTDEERGGNTQRAIFAIDLDLRFEDEDSFSNFKPSVGVEWRPNENILTYFTYSEGFKGGAFQGGQVTPILEPELIDNFEAGFKGEFLDQRLKLNLAGFFFEVEDMQLDRTRETAPGVLLGIFENAASAEGYGIEAESTWLVTEQFTLSGSLAWLETEFTDYTTDNPITAAAEIIDLSGNSLRQAPEFSYFIRGEYELPLANGAALTFGANASYKSRQYYTEFNDDITSQEGYTLVDLNVMYTSPNEKLTVNVWGKNVTDELVAGGAFVNALGRAITNTYLPPATAGITVGYDF